MASVSVDSANGEICTGKVTLTANTADTVTFTNDLDRFRLVVDSPSADVLLRKDGAAASTANAKFCTRIPAGSTAVLEDEMRGTSKVFSVFTTGTGVAYSIEKLK